MSARITSIVFVLMFFCLAVSAKTNGVKVLSKPVETKIEGLLRAHCVKIENGFQVCKGIMTREEGEDDARFVLEKDGKFSGSWSAEINMQASESEFEVVQGDLDGNGIDEIIVADFVAESLGMGVRIHRLHIFPDFTKNGFSKPVPIDVTEFGSLGTFIPNPATNEILILVCSWESSDKIEKVKSEKTYLIGRFVRYKKGKILPAFEKQIYARRYLYSFEKERDDSAGGNKQPYSWFVKKGKVLSFDPATKVETISRQRGVVEKIEYHGGAENGDEAYLSDNTLRAITVKLSSGESVRYVYTANNSEQDGTVFAQFENYGYMQGNKRVGPVVPPNVVYEKMEGVEVEIVKYKVEGGETNFLYFFVK